jgi:hypothetical protein
MLLKTEKQIKFGCYKQIKLGVLFYVVNIQSVYSVEVCVVRGTVYSLFVHL